MSKNKKKRALMRCSDIVCEVLLEHGTDVVFGYPGAAVLSLYDSLYTYSDRIRHIITANEAGAAHAADGFARSTGRTGVAIATSGPGATNLVTGIAAAYMDSVPMVIITGNVASGMIGRDAFQEIFITGITMPITKHNFLVKNAGELADTLRRAFLIAGRGRKGPVLVDIPKDVFDVWTEYVPAVPEPDRPKAAPIEDIERIAEALNRAERPFVQYGGGVVSSGCELELHELLHKGSIPACHTLMSAGLLSFDDELCLGMAGMHGRLAVNQALADADMVLAIGTRFSDRVVPDGKAFAPEARRFQIDIDRCEVNKNLPVEGYAIGDAKKTLEVLIPMVEQRDRSPWMKHIRHIKAGEPMEESYSALPPKRVIAALCDAAGGDAIFTTDVGQHQMWAAQYIERLKPRSFLTSGGLGAMGYGYGAAIGAAIGNPDRTVFHITGDGSLHMNMAEACTAVSYELPIVTVIFNNNALGMVRQWQKLFLSQRYSSTEPKRKTDYAALARGFGALGFRAENEAQLRDALRQAVADRRPSWIECIIDREELVLPMTLPGRIGD